MNDEVDRRAKGLVDCEFSDEPVVELQPVVDLVGQALVIDDDKDVEIGAVAFCCMRFIDPAASRVTAVKDDFLDPALLFPFMLGENERILEFFEDDRAHTLELALLIRRKIIEIISHLFQSSKTGVGLHPVFASFLLECAGTVPPP